MKDAQQCTIVHYKFNVQSRSRPTYSESESPSKGGLRLRLHTPG